MKAKAVGCRWATNRWPRCPGFSPGWSGPGCWAWLPRHPTCLSTSPSSARSTSSSTRRSLWEHPARIRTSSGCPHGQTEPKNEKETLPEIAPPLLSYNKEQDCNSWSHLCGVHYHRIAGEGVLQFEDLMEASSLRLPQLLLRHLDHKTHGGVGVVVLVVCDQRRNLLCAVQHWLKNILLVGLDNRGKWWGGGWRW